MNLLFMSNGLSPYGIPRSGLVSIIDPWRDTYGRNILPVNSENFVTGWVNNSGGTITITPNQPDPDGGNNAYRIQTSGITSNTVMYCRSSTIFNPHNEYVSIWMKKNSGGYFTGIGVGGGDGGVFCTNEWSLLTTSVKNRGTSTLTIWINTSSMTNLDILVYHPMGSNSSIYPYAPPAGLPQSTLDYSGHGNTFQLGSAAGSDTNDPKYNGVALVGDGVDDYAVASFASAAYRISIVDSGSGSGYTFVSEVPAYLDLFKTGASTYLNGKIGPTAYYNRVLTAGEIAQAKAGLKRYMASKGVTVS